MYVIVNTDLKMRKGRIAAQVGHIVQKIIEEIIHDIYETYPMPNHCITYMKWKNKCTKIVLGGTEDQLRDILERYPETRYFEDINNGNKELTVVGFFPSSYISPELSRLKLI